MHEIRKKLKVFRPEDVITIGFLVSLTIVIVVFRQRVDLFGAYVVKHVIIIVFYFIILYLHQKKKTRITSFARHWYPVFLFPVVYRGLESLIHIIVPHELDKFFIDVDSILFGCQPCLWMEQFVNPWLTEILQISYTTYYYFPTFLGIWFYVRKMDREYHDLLLAIVLTLYASFVGFLLVPVTGPRFFMAEFFTVSLKGKLIAPLVAEFMNMSGIRGGAFPSAHSALALVTLVFIFKYVRNFFYIALPIMICLFVSTIYGRYHYVGDVLAGFILGALCAYLAPKINRWWCL